jgi:D-alanyl-D-alanine carboxypeptidase
MTRFTVPRRIALCILVAAPGLLLSRAALADPVDDPIVAQADRLDAYLDSRMKSAHIAGLSVAVVRNGRPLLVRHFGLANVEWGAPTAPETVYQIASLTKQFTATAVMMLAEEGKLALDDRITAHLSGLPEAWSTVTIRHLLTHTSGIKSYTDLDEFWKTSRQEITKASLIKLIAKYPLQFEPGARFSYNNSGYFLLGMLIEQLSGKRYATFLNERIFQPLEMTGTRVNDLTEVIPRRASGYFWQGNRHRNGDYTSPSGPYAAGAIVSTVEDMAKWDSALYGEKLIRRASLEQMWTPMRLNNGRATDYGFGWVVTNYGKPNAYVHHGGGIPGFSTYIVRYLEPRITVILFSNTETDSWALTQGVYRTVTTGMPTSSP